MSDTGQLDEDGVWRKAIPILPGCNLFDKIRCRIKNMLSLSFSNRCTCEEYGPDIAEAKNANACERRLHNKRGGDYDES